MARPHYTDSLPWQPRCGFHSGANTFPGNFPGNGYKSGYIGHLTWAESYTWHDSDRESGWGLQSKEKWLGGGEGQPAQPFFGSFKVSFLVKYLTRGRKYRFCWMTYSDTQIGINGAGVSGFIPAPIQIKNYYYHEFRATQGYAWIFCNGPSLTSDEDSTLVNDYPDEFAAGSPASYPGGGTRNTVVALGWGKLTGEGAEAGIENGGYSSAYSACEPVCFIGQSSGYPDAPNPDYPGALKI